MACGIKNYTPTHASFSVFALSNAQTKAEIWINSQKFRVLSKNYLIFQESAKFALLLLGQQIFHENLR